MVHKMVNIWFVINNYQHTIKTNMIELENIINAAFEQRADITPANVSQEVRGAVHHIDGWPDGTDAVLVLNDAALDNPDVRHFLVLPYVEGEWRPEIVLINADDLGDEVRALSDYEQNLLSDELRSIFPLKGVGDHVTHPG